MCGSILPAPVCGPLRGELGCRCSSGCWHAGLSSSGSRGSWWWRCGCSSRSDADTYCTPYGPVKEITPPAKRACFKATHKHKHLVSIVWTQCGAREAFNARQQQNVLNAMTQNMYAEYQSDMHIHPYISTTSHLLIHNYIHNILYSNTSKTSLVSLPSSAGHSGR